MNKMEYKFTSIGKFMFKLVDKLSSFLIKHKWLYYILLYTWALPLTLIGWVIALFLLIIGKKPQNYHGMCMFRIKERWGGFSIGQVIVRDTTSSDKEINPHEYGHSFQLAIFGFFTLFLVIIPSVIRYWYRELKYERKLKIPPTDYDDIWFEGSATYVGNKAVEVIK